MVALLLALALVAAACGDDAAGDEPGGDGATSADGAGDDPDGSGAGDDAGGDDDAGADNGAGGDETADDEPRGAADDAGPADAGGFPVEVDTAGGPVTIPAAPARIVSLSPTATEMLFAIGAGGEVVAVDQYSNHPPEAPPGTLDGFVPDLEAILANEPDLVVASSVPEDVAAGLVAGGVPLLLQPAAASFDDTYDQIAQLGEATGRLDEAASLNAEIRASIEAILGDLPERDEPVRVFHEIDDSFYTATSGSFIGQVYQTMGFDNIADPLDDGTGFPLIDGESVIAADPTLIVFTSQAPYDRDDIAARPGWNTVTAVVDDQIVQVDADIASRWGPRIVEFMEAIAAVVSGVAP